MCEMCLNDTFCKTEGVIVFPRFINHLILQKKKKAGAEETNHHGATIMFSILFFTLDGVNILLSIECQKAQHDEG